MLETRICDIKGTSTVYKLGDQIAIGEPEILLANTDALCIHAVSTLLHYVVALERRAAPLECGISKSPDCAYVQCIDPGQPYTDEGIVVFSATVLKERLASEDCTCSRNPPRNN